MLDILRIIEDCQFEYALGKWVEDLAYHRGSAIVCTSELSPKQIEKARRTKRLLVRQDGIGVALMFGWKHAKKWRND